MMSKHYAIYHGPTIAALRLVRQKVTFRTAAKVARRAVGKAETAFVPVTDVVGFTKPAPDLWHISGPLGVAVIALYPHSAPPEKTHQWPRDGRGARICAHCGHPFVSPYPSKRYCGQRCRNAATTARNKGTNGHA